MDPNNSQQQGVPSQQAAPQPPSQVPVQPVADQQPTQYQNPSVNKSSKTTFLLIVLLIVVIGMAVFFIFLANQGNYSQNVPAATPSTSSPSLAPLSPSPAPETDDLNLEDPEADLKDLENSTLEL